MEGGMKNWRFSTNILLYFENDTIYEYDHSYNGRRIGTRIRAICRMLPFPMTLNDLEWHFFRSRSGRNLPTSNKLRYGVSTELPVAIDRRHQNKTNFGFEWCSEIFNDTKHRAASLRQLRFSYWPRDVNSQNGRQLQCFSMTSVTQFVTQSLLSWRQEDAATWSTCPSTTNTTFEKHGFKLVFVV